MNANMVNILRSSTTFALETGVPGTPTSQAAEHMATYVSSLREDADIPLARMCTRSRAEPSSAMVLAKVHPEELVRRAHLSPNAY
jgi:hypothetical protein